MGIGGSWVKTFSEANLASAVDVHMNDDVPFFWDVVKVEGRTVTLRSHKDGETVIECRITKRKTGYEQVSIQHSGAFEALFNRKPRTVRLMPFKGQKY